MISKEEIQKVLYRGFMVRVESGDWALYKTIAGIAYYMPDSDEEYIFAAHHELKLATSTGFYEFEDMDDWQGSHSEYSFVEHEGRLMTRSKAEEVFMENLYRTKD